MNSRTFGKIGEEIAEAYLKRKGHRIITVNYRTYGGELDIVSLHKGVLVFTEVKSKGSPCRGAPWQELSYTKIQRLKKAAYWFRRVDGVGGKIPYYIGRLRLGLSYYDYRFDLIEVSIKNEKPIQIIHTKNVIKTER